MGEQNQYLQLSFFDRLIQDAEYKVLGGRVTDIEIVRNAVLRDVENLLNTRRSIIQPPKSYQCLNNSLFVYGLEDFVSKNPKSPHVRKALKSSIEETINKFEPRLRDALVGFNSEEGNEQNLCFAVSATLHADPVQEPICFDTWFSVNRGEYKVNNVQ